MSRPITESLLRSLVGRAEQEDGARVLLVHAAPNWSGSEVISTEAGPAHIISAVSTLGVREVLSRRDPNGERLIILTDRDERDLGAEVLARVWRNRVVRPSGWDALAHLFDASSIDPALADHRWLVELLVDVAPAHKYPRARSGLLDIDTARRTFLRHALRLETDQPTAVDLLRWGQTDSATAALHTAIADHINEVTDLLRGEVGTVAPHVLRLVAAGRPGDLVPFGLVCDVLWSPAAPTDAAIVAARARFETPLGTSEMGETTARVWGNAATTLVENAADAGDHSTVQAWLSRAQQQLAEIKALELAGFSDVLPEGFTRRLDDAGGRVSTALRDPSADTLDAAEDCARLVQQHLRSRIEPERLNALQMAVRLVRYLGAARPGLPADMSEATTSFVTQGAWVDAARDALSDGETVHALAGAYRAIITRIDADRLERDLHFAQTFAGWSALIPSASTTLLPIERVLDNIVVPVARQLPTLLLVVDGLSQPEAARLFDDIVRAGWTLQAPVDRDVPAVVAAVPTITNVSRTTLLCGRLLDGNAKIERIGFSEHAGLREVASSSEPRLFHKSDLRADEGRIAPEVVNVIADPQMRVVGVVVNGVDDHLAKGTQLRIADGLSGIKPLRWLLEAATEANRVVVVTSDHGHIREHGTTVRPRSGGGERWRTADLPAETDEVELSGPRVLRGNGTVIAPATPTIRYNAVEKYGYHGGATPEEVVCPLAIFTPAAVSLDGWQPAPLKRPDWWEARDRRPARVPRAFERPAPVVEPGVQSKLFDELDKAPAQPATPIEWIADVLVSPVLEQQRQLAGRTALDDDQLIELLTHLDPPGTPVPLAAIARATKLPASRVRSKLEALRRMMNVEGYVVLALESDGTARLNRDLLATQFEV